MGRRSATNRLVVTTHEATYWRQNQLQQLTAKIIILKFYYMYMKQKTKQKKKKQQRQRHYIFLRLDTQIRSTVAGVLNWHEPAAAKWSVYRCLDDVATLRQESAESEAETCRLCCCSYPSLRSLLNLQPGGTSLMLSLYILQVDDDDNTRGRRWSCRRSWRGMAIGLPLCMWGACNHTGQARPVRSV